jgi:6-pyruvoyltetrahydropterin/6-carboxytetrahydropterin synthase
MPQPPAHTCSKRFSDYPCCHRQWRHPGHCRFVHGYSRSFTCWFQARRLDRHGFVVDFSSLRPLEQRLAAQFDHTFLVNADDPLLDQWRALHEQGALDLRVMENVGMEASAELVWHWANELIQQQEGGRACCWRVEARENDRNAACFTAVPHWFTGEGWPQEPLDQVSYAEPASTYGSGAADLEPPAAGEPWEAP